MLHSFSAEIVIARNSYGPKCPVTSERACVVPYLVAVSSIIVNGLPYLGYKNLLKTKAVTGRKESQD